MNTLSKVLLFIVCILAFATLLFFFKFVTERAYNKDLIAQKDAFSLEAMKRGKFVRDYSERTLDAQKAAEEAIMQAMDHFTAASEIKAELERLQAESVLTQKETIALLNARIEREAQIRLRAEREAEKYLTQKTALEHELLMFWSDMETLKSENANSMNALAGKLDGEKSALASEIKDLKSALEDIKKNLEIAKISKDTAEEKIKSLERELEALKAHPPSSQTRSALN